MSLKLETVYEDDDIWVINKYPGVVVNDAASVSTATIQSAITEYLSEQPQVSDWHAQIPDDFSPEYGTPEEIFAERKGMVHRLDKDTSGVLVFAKNPGSLVHLLWQFRTRQVQKEYRCLVHGVMALKENFLSFPIGRTLKDRKKFGVVAGGRESITHIKVLQEFAQVRSEAVPQLKNSRESLYQGFSLVACWPKTGRTHQIRVHLSHIAHPIVGDSVYVGKKRAKLDSLWCPRQFLHAHSLTLMHPRTREKVSFTAPLTQDLQEVLECLDGGKT